MNQNIRNENIKGKKKRFSEKCSTNKRKNFKNFYNSLKSKGENPGKNTRMKDVKRKEKTT